MEDFIGVLVFVAFAAFSMISRFKKAKPPTHEELDEPSPTAPRWPGPVAAPGVPGYPRPAWPQRAGPEGRRGPSWPSAESAQADNEGVSIEGQGPEGGPSLMEWIASEGPPDERAEAEAARFDPESERFRAGRVAAWNRTGGELAESQALEAEATVPLSGGDGLSIALSDRGSLARAIVMAEVLGKPKALQRGRR